MGLSSIEVQSMGEDVVNNPISTAESSCDLVYPKFGDKYYDRDSIYFMFFCLLSRDDLLRLRNNGGYFTMKWSIFLFNENSQSFQLERQAETQLNVPVTFKAISQDFKISNFHKKTRLAKFVFKIFIENIFIGALSTVVELVSDSYLKLINPVARVTEFAGNTDRNIDFIEIGTSGFDTLIEAAQEYHSGISIEPLSHLQNLLPDRINITKISCAIADETGWKDIYFIPSEFLQFEGISIKNYSNNRMLYGLGRLGEVSSVIKNQIGNSGFMGPLVTNVERSIVPVKTIENIFLEYGIKSVTFLKLDCEGFDNRILKSAFGYFLDKHIPLPHYIEFENNSDFKGAEELIYSLISLGYSVYSFFYEVKIVDDASITTTHGVVYCELNPIYYAADRLESALAVDSLLPNELKKGRELCKKYRGEYPNDPTIVMENSSEIFCTVLHYDDRDDVMSISSVFKYVL